MPQLLRGKRKLIDLIVQLKFHSNFCGVHVYYNMHFMHYKTLRVQYTVVYHSTASNVYLVKW